jgi:hypothetical protein
MPALRIALVLLVVTDLYLVLEFLFRINPAFTIRYIGLFLWCRRETFLEDQANLEVIHIRERFSANSTDWVAQSLEFRETLEAWGMGVYTWHWKTTRLLEIDQGFARDPPPLFIVAETEARQHLIVLTIPRCWAERIFVPYKPQFMLRVSAKVQSKFPSHKDLQNSFCTWEHMEFNQILCYKYASSSNSKRLVTKSIGQV